MAGGAKLAFGGKRVERSGLFFYPTVLTDVDEDNYAALNESFGPIMIISKFSERDVDDVVERANRTEYGLAAGVFSKVHFFKRYLFLGYQPSHASGEKN